MLSAGVKVLPPTPDLQVAGLAAIPSSGLQSGGTLTLQWSDSNTGNGFVSTPFSDLVQAVDTSTGQTLASAPVPYHETARGPIAGGGSAAQQFSFQLPYGLPGVGQLQVTVTTDVNNQVPEFNPSGTGATNNSATLTTSSSLGSTPDLHATGLTIDPSSVVQSVASVTLDWNDANVGNAAASGACPTR